MGRRHAVARVPYRVENIVGDPAHARDPINNNADVAAPRVVDFFALIPQSLDCASLQKLCLIGSSCMSL